MNQKMKSSIIVFLVFILSMFTMTRTGEAGGAGTYPEKTTPALTDTALITETDAAKPEGFAVKRVRLENLPVSTPVQKALDEKMNIDEEGKTTFADEDGNSGIFWKYPSPGRSPKQGEYSIYPVFHGLRCAINGEAFNIATEPILSRLSVSTTTPIVQGAPPTSASAVGWYLTTTSGDAFYKTPDGLFNISAGTYTKDKVVPTASKTLKGTEEPGS